MRELHTSWLRHNCPTNKQPYSGQKGSLDPSIFAPPCRTSRVETTDDGGLRVRWAADGAVSEFDAAWLTEYALPELPELPALSMLVDGFLSDACSPTVVRDDVQQKASPVVSQIPRVSWKTVVGSDEGLFEWLDALRTKGMCLITDAPTTDGTVVGLANTISQPQPTIYGTTFDVVSVPEPINIA